MAAIATPTSPETSPKSRTTRRKTTTVDLIDDADLDLAALRRALAVRTGKADVQKGEAIRYALRAVALAEARGLDLGVFVDARGGVV